MSRLFLFTVSFPFGFEESFLEPEVPYLAQAFDEVTVVPMWVTDAARLRVVPANVKVEVPVIRGNTRNDKNGFKAGRALGKYLRDFLSNHVLFSRKRLRAWARSFYLTNCLLNSPVIRRVEASFRPGDLCYFYWGIGSANLAPFWKGKVKMVTRFHATSDLWEEKWGNYTPLRRQVAAAIDKAVFISDAGRDYFAARYPGCEMLVSRLGSVDHGESSRSTDGVLRVVSCSHVIPVKRVALILEALERASRQVRIAWTHIGTGKDLDAIRKRAEALRSDRFEAVFTGQMAHEAVFEYYKTHPVDLFINMSSSEGIPVSVIEAISFDIPCIATDVGATREVVTAETGMLVPGNCNAEEAARAVLSVADGHFSPRRFWMENYDSDRNDRRFAAFLKTLVAS